MATVDQHLIAALSTMPALAIANFRAVALRIAGEQGDDPRIAAVLEAVAAVGYDGRLVRVTAALAALSAAEHDRVQAAISGLGRNANPGAPAWRAFARRARAVHDRRFGVGGAA